VQGIKQLREKTQRRHRRHGTQEKQNRVLHLESEIRSLHPKVEVFFYFQLVDERIVLHRSAVKTTLTETLLFNR